MRANNYILLICISLIFGCESKERLNSNTLMEVYTEYYDNGNVKSKGSTNNRKERAGYWEYFDEDKSIKAKGSYIEGFKVNTWHYYQPERIIDWTVYADSVMGVKLNVPSTFQSYPNYKNSKTLVFINTVQSDSFHVNFNISKYDFNENSSIEERIGDVVDNIEISKLKAIEINNRVARVNHSVIKNQDLEVYLSQIFLNSKNTLYVLNFFNVDMETLLFYEVAFSLRIENEK